MRSKPNQDYEAMVDRAAERLRSQQMSPEQLLLHAAAMEVSAAIGLRAMEDLRQVLLGLQAAERAAGVASQSSTRIGEAIALMDVPPFARVLVEAGKSIHAAQAVRDSRLNGSRGGVRRSERTNGLKTWALREARAMKGDDKSIARALADSIPAIYADASKDPERLIYDAIRQERAKA